MNWSSGLKKPISLIAIIGGLLAAITQPESADSIQQLIGAIVAALGAGGYLVENKRDSAARESRSAIYPTREEVLDIVKSADPWDPDIYHETVIVPAALIDKERNLRDSFVLSCFYCAMSRLRQPRDNPKAGYMLGLALAAFQSVWKMSYDEAIAKLPEWKAQCLGTDLFSVARRKGINYYAIAFDVKQYRERYEQAWTPGPIYEPDFAPSDY